MTIAYLIFELGFNARLLDVTGSLADEEEIRSIEIWGRLISGTAVALVAWGTFLMPLAWRRSWTVGNTTSALVISGAILIWATYCGERSLVDHLVDQSSGSARRTAAELRLVTNALLDDEVSISGIDLPPPVVRSPEGKSFIALFPFIALSTSGVRNTLERALPQVVDYQLRRRLGSPEHVYNAEFRASVEVLRDDYNEYVDAGRRASGDDPDPEAMWHKFIDTLSQNYGTTPERLPGLSWRRVAQQVQQMGVPVPPDWNPQDHRTFIAAARLAISKRVQATGGTSIPTGLSWSAFIERPEIQQSWKAALVGRLPTLENGTSALPLRPDMSFDAFRAQIYEPLIGRQAKEELAVFGNRDIDFGPGGQVDSIGRRGIEAVLVPPIALLFSLAGALTHTFKSARYLSVLRGGSVRRTAIIAAAVLLVAFSALLIPNEVTRSETFRNFAQATAAQEGAAAALGVRWVIQAQPFAYPINDWVRLKLLGGMTFGCQSVHK